MNLWATQWFYQWDHSIHDNAKNFTKWWSIKKLLFFFDDLTTDLNQMALASANNIFSRVMIKLFSLDDLFGDTY